MSNMSYCRFQNTETDLRDCVNAMREEDDMPGMDLSRDEAHALARMFDLCQEFITEATRVAAATTVDSLQG